MVDDRTQRPFGANEPARSAPKSGNSGNDPLAELARLIGQQDPFGELANARRASAPPTHAPPEAWTDVPQPAPVAPEPQQAQVHAVPQFLSAKPAAKAAPSVMPSNFSRQAFGSAPPNDDLYHVEGTPAFDAVSTQDHESYHQPAAQFGVETDDYYEEEPPASRKRMGILVIAGVFALAVIGTAGAFGYRALFGGSSSSVPPPVIKADTTPSKIVPAGAKDTGKQITDRINDKGMERAPGERLVSREEQPVAVQPQPDNPPPAAMAQSAQPPAPSGTGVVSGAEPKKVRTIAIRPDQGMSDPGTAPQPAPPAAAPQASAPPPAPSAPVRVIPTTKPSAPPQRAAANPPAEEERPAPAPRAPANAPLSLNPNAAPARPAAPAPVARTASVAPAGAGGYLVQVTSQRSEAEAQSAFASLQGKYPGQLGGKQAVIRKVELGEKGTYYRASVSAGNAAEASQICSGIKAAGGSCLVQKN